MGAGARWWSWKRSERHRTNFLLSLHPRTCRGFIAHPHPARHICLFPRPCLRWDCCLWPRANSGPSVKLTPQCRPNIAKRNVPLVIYAAACQGTGPLLPLPLRLGLLLHPTRDNSAHPETTTIQACNPEDRGSIEPQHSPPWTPSSPSSLSQIPKRR